MPGPWGPVYPLLSATAGSSGAADSAAAEHNPFTSDLLENLLFTVPVLLLLVLLCFLQQLVEFRARHFQHLGMCLNPLPQPVELRRIPAAFKLSTVLALFVQFEIVGVHQVGEL